MNTAEDIYIIYVKKRIKTLKNYQYFQLLFEIVNISVKFKIFDKGCFI